MTDCAWYKIANLENGYYALSLDTVDKKLDAEILDSLDAESVEQEILDADEFNQHIDINIRRYKECDLELRSSTPQDSETQAPVPPADAAAVNTVNVNGEESNPMSTFYTSTPQAQAHTEILLKTAVAPVWFEDRSAMSNILLDEGSQKSFISEDLAAQLQLKPCGNSTISLSTFGNANQNVRHMDKAQITLETETGGFIPMDVLIVPRIAAPLSNVTNVIASKLPYLKGLRLANPVTEDRKFELSLLIGADYYWSIVQDHVIRGDGPTAVKSRLGYLLSGPMHTFTGEQSSTGMFNVLIQHQQEERSLEKFWDLESIGVKADELETTTMKDFNDEYETKCITYQDNRYTAKLPWRNDFNELPTNYNVTLRRTCNMIDRLKKDTNMLKMYGDIIKDQKRRGFIERVTENGNQSNRIHYIPHHAVKKDSSTTPIRIVYDCSCHESPHKASLNDCLMSVPPMLNDLTGILARFRLHKHAVTTDIEKAFLNVELDKEDRDVTRFFWLSDPSDPDSPLITYRFRVVLFGTTCSPYILNATLMKHFKLNSCKTAEILKNDLYVDNVLSSFWDEKEMLKFYRESRDLLARGGFNLRSWTSNSTELLRLAQSEKCIERDTNIKILGLRWNESNENQKWRYCPTDANPADLLTRGITGTKFINNRLWFHGPEWITDKTQWPTWSGNEIVENENIMEIPTNETSEKQHVLLTSQKRQEFGIHKIMDIERYSSLKTLIRVTAYVMRFIQNSCYIDMDTNGSEIRIS
ncbi:Hypothetical predicted protein [Mytilus galloprovincialis]|uniref:Peptidase aspartic putative domain-containing protein n=1 Tax=Mytilus galloprovincialis TaxID=29158 RepID=A0A8B6H5N2_MYTGA|nr:Hypothetical predicted protein [Mytilus galloprovincialis]